MFCISGTSTKLCLCIFICVFVFVFVYLTVGHLGISFLTSLNQQLFRNIAYVWYFWHFNKAVFVYLYLCICICICVFVYLTDGNISFDVLGAWAFQKCSSIRFSKIFWAW